MIVIKHALKFDRNAKTANMAYNLSIFGLIVGVSPSGKALGFDPSTPRFESWHPR